MSEEQARQRAQELTKKALAEAEDRVAPATPRPPQVEPADEQHYAPAGGQLDQPAVQSIKHALGIQLGIRFEQLQGRGQIVIHELAHLRQLVRVLLGLGKNFGADGFQPADLIGHFLEFLDLIGNRRVFMLAALYNQLIHTVSSILQPKDNY